MVLAYSASCKLCGSRHPQSLEFCLIYWLVASLSPYSIVWSPHCRHTILFVTPSYSWKELCIKCFHNWAMLALHPGASSPSALHKCSQFTAQGSPRKAQGTPCEPRRARFFSKNKSIVQQLFMIQPMSQFLLRSLTLQPVTERHGGTWWRL